MPWLWSKLKKDECSKNLKCRYKIGNAAALNDLDASRHGNAFALASDGIAECGLAVMELVPGIVTQTEHTRKTFSTPTRIPHSRRICQVQQDFG